MSYIIAIANQKGSVGRTTTAVDLAACLAKSGRRVLVVDVDTQANCTSHFGIHPEEARLNAYHALIKPESDIRECFGPNCFSRFHRSVQRIDASMKRNPVITVDRCCYAVVHYFRLSHEVIHEL